ncbi:MAG: hypothetical protein MPW15_00880 [Candidatus Manganitrophus sp.]|nr:hypothetical protein [Candidatus Manganitrophus sp.]
MNHRGGVDRVVENDRQTTTPVLFRYLLKESCTDRIKGDGDIRRIEVSDRHAGIAQQITRQRRPALDQKRALRDLAGLFVHHLVQRGSGRPEESGLHIPE